MISLKNISKSFHGGSLKALSGITLEVKSGGLFGLIGPDGAGKTTLFRILTTLMLPDSGDAFIKGLDIKKDVAAIRSILGYMPGRFSLYQDLTVDENLRFFATLFGTSINENYQQIKEIYIQLEPFKNRRAGKLSGGMKQKLALCCALIHRPEVLILDEPTTGVDAVSRKEFWEMLARLKADGITILVSTPYMDEATRCDTIALIDKGAILSIDTPGNIVSKYPRPLYALKAKNLYRLQEDLRLHPNIYSCFAFGEFLHISFRNQEETSIPGITQWLEEKGHQQVVLKKQPPVIEDCFIDLLKH